MPGTPLWSHTLSTAVYKIYESSSLKAKVGQPTGSSKLCLSCHDGTVALTETITGGTGGAYISAGGANLGTDLSDDHPISFVYSSGLSAEDSQIRPPVGLPEPLKLDRSGELQCTTCHDAHDNHYGNFLVMSNDGIADVRELPRPERLDHVRAREFRRSGRRGQRPLPAGAAIAARWRRSAVLPATGRTAPAAMKGSSISPRSKTIA